MKIKSIVILSAALLAGAALSHTLLHKQPAKSIETSSVENLNALVAENYQAVNSQFDESMSRALPVEKLSTTWSAFTKSAGRFKRVQQIHTGTSGQFEVASLRCEFERVVVDVRFCYDQKGKITGFWIVPV
jgi:hypothetical protein